MQLGVPTDGSAGFVWDNEGPPVPPQLVPSFLVAAKPVTVAEFHCFAIGEQGYSKQELWSPDDWSLIQQFRQVLHPACEASQGSLECHYPAVLGIGPDLVPRT